MKTHVIAGWILMLAGTALWVYGYFIAGHPPLIDWKADTPSWIAEFLPNLESEMGMVLVFIAMVPIYWPAKS
jgi:Ni,Fe-hydrogenase I cytochrome b subunit